MSKSWSQQQRSGFTLNFSVLNFFVACNDAAINLCVCVHLAPI